MQRDNKTLQIQFRAYSLAAQAGAAAGAGDPRGFSPDQYTDIRYDEEYEKFYRQSVANGVKLPPPVDSTTLYSQLPQYSQQHAPPRPPGSMLGPQPSYGAVLGRPLMLCTWTLCLDRPLWILVSCMWVGSTGR